MRAKNRLRINLSQSTYKNTCYLMKKLFLSLSLATAGMAYAAEIPTVTYTEPEPIARWWMELAANANLAERRVMEKEPWGNSPKVHTWGGDLTISYAATQLLALNVRLSCNYGTGDIMQREMLSNYREEMSLTNVGLMPGFRLYLPISGDEESSLPTTAFFIGGNVGLQFCNINLKSQYDTWFVIPETYTLRHDFYALGLGGSAEAGMSFRLPVDNEEIWLTLSYRLTGSTAQPVYREEGMKAKAARQIYHSISCGVCISF